MERQKRSFSLRGAALLLAGACLLLFTIAFFIVFYSTMPSILQDVAKAEMGEKLERLEDLLLADREKALASASFMARGEDVARFVQGQNDGYAEEHLPGAFPLDALDYNFLFMWDAEGNLAHTQQYNFMGDEPYWMPASIQDAFLSVANDALAAAARSADATQEEAGLAGLLFYEDEAYLVSCAPVQGGGAQPVGSVLLGRRVDDAYLLWRTGFGQGSFVWDAAPTAARLEGATTATEETLEGQLPLQDIYGHAVLLSFLDENPEYPTVQHRLNRTSGLIFSMMLLLALGLYFIINRLFLNPVERLTHALDDVGEFQRVEDPQRDPTREFQTLVAAINGMLERLDMQSLSMNSLSSILNGMEAFLFVSEPETDEILFMNDKMRALYAQPQDIEGRLCWQVLHPHRTQRCEQCPIDALQEDPAKTVTWEEYSDTTGRCYQNTDGIIEWTDGRPVHIRHSIDITEMKTAQDALAQRLLQQELVAAISQSFIATPDINIFINDAIAAAGRFIDVSKVLVARAEPK
ncbi:hypothetical protein LJC04_06895, partial [Ruminococcaceae bacterium OttesenSCG-928-O06]|nr:hypothetical protein [Ruminococcaceae bacterium OttesenSCG-928-O06]